MLIGNYSVLNKTAGRWLAGNSTAHTSGIGTNTSTKSSIMKWSDWRKFNAEDNAGQSTIVLVKTAAKPRGYYGQGAFALPTKAGEMAAWVTGTNTVTATALLGKLMTASISGSNTVTASMGLVISMVAALTANGAVSATLLARLNMTAAINGGGSITGTLTGIANLTANLSCVGTAAGSTMTGIGYMYCDITSEGTALTINNVANAVWDAVLADHLTSGSTGAALNAAGSAGDPWSTVLPGSYSGSQAGALFGTMVTVTNEMHERDGLKSGVPVLITPTGLTSSNISQVYTTAGTDTTVTRS